MFQEFSQVANMLQYRAKGTGLGSAAVAPAGRTSGRHADIAQHTGRRIDVHVVYPDLAWRSGIGQLPRSCPNPDSRAAFC